MVALSLLVVAICVGVYGEDDVPKEEPDTPCTLCTIPLCRVFPRNDNISSDLTVNFKNLTLIFRRTEHKSRMNKLFTEGCDFKLVNCQTTMRRSPLRIGDRQDLSVMGLFFVDYRRTRICLFEISDENLQCHKMRQRSYIRAIDPFNNNVYYTHKNRTIVTNSGKKKSKYIMQGAADDVILAPGEDRLIYSKLGSGLFMSKKSFKSKTRLIDAVRLSVSTLIMNFDGRYQLLVGSCDMYTYDCKSQTFVSKTSVPGHFCNTKGLIYKSGSTLFNCGEKFTTFDLSTKKELTSHEKHCSRCAVHGSSILCSFFCEPFRLCL